MPPRPAKPYSLFHLAFPSHNLGLTKRFFTALGCKVGRQSKHSLIMNLGGNQIVAQRIAEKPAAQKGIYPRHFGLIFPNLKAWQILLKRAEQKKLEFYQSPKIRYPGTPLEHHTFFLKDPSNNLLEFKYYSHASAVFGKRHIKNVGDPR